MPTRLLVRFLAFIHVMIAPLVVAQNFTTTVTDVSPDGTAFATATNTVSFTGPGNQPQQQILTTNQDQQPQAQTAWQAADTPMVPDETGWTQTATPTAVAPNWNSTQVAQPINWDCFEALIFDQWGTICTQQPQFMLNHVEPWMPQQHVSTSQWTNTGAQW